VPAEAEMPHVTGLRSTVVAGREESQRRAGPAEPIIARLDLYPLHNQEGRDA